MVDDAGASDASDARFRDARWLFGLYNGGAASSSSGCNYTVNVRISVSYTQHMVGVGV